MSATEFASSAGRWSDGRARAAAPVRYPRPAVLARPLKVEGAKAQHGAAALGLETVGDLLEHLPRDRREARAVAQLVAGETATVVVEVRAIASRPVRRRGMRPLVEATVADDTGSMKATFFNQPWLVQRYPAGTRLVLHGKFEARNRFRVQGHAQTSEAASGDDGGGPLPGHRGAVLDPDPGPGPRPRRRHRRGARAAALACCGCASCCPSAAPRWPRSTSPAASPSRRWAAAGWPSTSCCWSSWRCCGAGGCAARARPRRRSTASPS